MTYLPETLLFLPSIGIAELSILFVIVLILFGPGKLPEVCRAAGDGIKQFKGALGDSKSEDTKSDIDEKPVDQNV